MPSAISPGSPAQTQSTVAKLVFSGRGLGISFLAFAQDRAARLGLDGCASITTPSREITLIVSGLAPLIDMLEVACLLGPTDCLVEAVARDQVSDRWIPNGFRLDALVGSVPDRRIA